MSMQTDFVALAGPLVAGRVYPQGDAPAYVGPYITYFRVIADEQSTLDTNGGTGNLINTRLQADVYALSYGEAQTTAMALKAAMKGWALANVLIAEQDMREDDNKLHRVMLSVSVWHH